MSRKCRRQEIAPLQEMPHAWHHGRPMAQVKEILKEVSVIGRVCEEEVVLRRPNNNFVHHPVD
jgi:hypothetical protein